MPAACSTRLQRYTNRWLVRLACAQKVATTLALIAEAFTAIGGVPAKVLALRTRQNSTAMQLGAPIVRQVLGIPLRPNHRHLDLGRVKSRDG